VEKTEGEQKGATSGMPRTSRKQGAVIIVARQNGEGAGKRNKGEKNEAPFS